MAKKKNADFNESMSLANTMSNPTIYCRSMSHAWAQWQAITYPRGKGYKVFYLCSRGCGVTRVEEWDKVGHVLSSKLFYPKEGYLVRGRGRVNRGAMRIARLHLYAKRLDKKK